MQRIPVKKANDLFISSQSSSSPEENGKSKHIKPELDFTVSLASRLISLSHTDLSKAMRFTDLHTYSPSFPHHPCQAQLLLYHQERNNLQTAQGKLLDLVTRKVPDKTQMAQTLYKKSSILLNDQVLQYSPSSSGHFLPNLTTTVASASKKAQNKKKLKANKTRMPALKLSKIGSLRL